MASFSVTNNIYLRNVYSPNRTLSVKANRTDVSNEKLSSVDTAALHKAIRKLSDLDYSNVKKDDLELSLKAFVDSYNYSVSSTGSTTEIKGLAKQLKSLTKEHEKELNNFGITIDESSGYMKLSTSATTNIKPQKFEALFGSDSKYMNDLSTLSKKINSSIDVYL